MSASTSGYHPPGGWSWPDNLNEAKPTGGVKTDEHKPPQPAHRPKNTERQRHWRPRTCRICLETVLPSFNVPSENLPGIFQATPSVSYDSEGGRLLRPCKCKGSSKYVHESCLQQWRHADPDSRRHYWQCPTCHFQYRLERMAWGRWISSRVTQVSLTLLIFIATIFLLGFIADPIINLYLDPYDTIVHSRDASGRDLLNEDDSSWTLHLMKGLASLGLLGFVKVLFTLSPWHWWNMRTSGMLGSHGRGGHGTTGRDRVANISWIVIILGAGTFLYAVWKGVRAWSRRVLQKATERVVDVQGDEDED